MDTAEAQSSTLSLPSSGRYGLGPPWLFRGRALYQLHLVKAEVARPFVPKELKLVEAFGYTLGGLFLAQYEDSPAGAFDELVVIAGIVWNPPTSCAWAARVLVNSHEACRHGRKEIGLPSHVAVFSKRDKQAAGEPLNGHQSFLDRIGISSIFSKKREHREIEISEIQDSSEMSICNIRVPLAGDGWPGPMIRMSLPSFSGQTIHNPHLLKYSCQIACRVRAMPTAKISRTDTSDQEDNREDKQLDVSLSSEDEAFRRSISVLLSKPILALDFSLLKMQVEAPTVVAKQPLSRTTNVGDVKTC